MLTIPLRLVHLDFMALHHVELNEFDEAGLLFDEAMGSLAREDHPMFGDRLELVHPSPKVAFAWQDTVAVHILDATKMCFHKVGQAAEEQGKYLHQLRVTTWKLSVDRERLGAGDTVEVLAERGYSGRLLVVLDEEWEVKSSLYYREGHLAALFEVHEFEALVKESQALEDDLDIALIWDWEVWLGRTQQHAHDNQHFYDKAWTSQIRLLNWATYSTMAMKLVRPEDSNEAYLKRPGAFTKPNVLIWQGCSMFRRLPTYLKNNWL